MNCIIYGNEINIEQPDGYGDDYTKVTVHYSNIEGGEDGILLGPGDIVDWGVGNINANPLFTAAGSGYFNLDTGSPSIDTGNPHGIYNDTD